MPNGEKRPADRDDIGGAFLDWRSQKRELHTWFSKRIPNKSMISLYNLVSYVS